MNKNKYPIGEHPNLPAPEEQSGIIKTLQRNLFSTWYNSILTVVFSIILWNIFSNVITWSFINADFFTTSRQDCTSGGACWGVITQRIDQYLYGFYPDVSYWRPNLAFVLLIVAITPIFWSTMPARKHFFMLSALYPFIAFWLLYGGFGLDPIPSSKIGGVTLTLTLGVMGIALSLPIGILLALGRRSTTMPTVSLFCVLFIEFIRGVPMIALLFMATVVLPLFLPPGTDIEQLSRVIFIVVLFASVYMAETIRGGLQAISKGQYEAADALGLGYWRKMRLIILPQALRISIPGIVNNFISLFKDTTLVVIVSMFDLLGVGRAALANREWIGLTTEVYAFISVVFFVFCYGMARYSTYLEQKLSTGHK